jgi:hypothetical protein
MSLVLIGGAHRGAESIFNQLPDKTVRRYDPNWKLADPKPDRAVQLARKAQDRFPTLQPQPLQMRVQDALPYSRDHDTVVLALDTLVDTMETLQARLLSQRVTYQLVGRGPGDAAGIRLAIQGTICPEDQGTARRALLFLQTLAGMSQAASSLRLTGPDPLSAAVLKPLRQVASRQTARHLGEKEREPWDLSGGPLCVMFGPTIYPLIPVQGVPQDTHVQWEARALDTVGEVPAKLFAARGVHGGAAMVAVVIPAAQAIHFMTVVQSRTGKRRIAGVRSFVSPRRQQQSQSAVFTD